MHVIVIAVLYKSLLCICVVCAHVIENLVIAIYNINIIIKHLAQVCMHACVYLAHNTITGSLCACDMKRSNMWG